MKKNQIFVATLCASALVLSACTIGRTPSKKKKSSSQDVPTSVVPGPTSSGTTTSGTPAPTPTSGTSTAPVKVLQSIAVTTAPTTTVYTDGQSFDKTGMVVTATYSDGSTANVTDQCQFSPTVLTESTTAVTITFGGQSTTQAVTVNAPVPTSWTAAQLEMLNYYLEDQGSQIPFKYVAGAELFRDTENAMLTYGDGTDTCSEDFIKEYVGLFSTDWNIEVNQLYLAYYDALIYEGSKTFNEGESNEVTVYVSFYGLGDDGYITNDGTGHFGLDLYDDFYYSWEEFAEEYQSVLDYVYDTTDEEGEEVAFPDAIQFEGETSFIEVEDKLDSNGYYVAYLYGVAEVDYLEYIEAFYDSGKWTGYTDTLQGCEAYYHESEKVSVGYIYQADYNRLILIIYPYEKIYRAWSEVEPVLDEYIDTVNPETTVKVPAFEADSYIVEDHSENGYYIVGAFGTDDKPLYENDLKTYAENLDSTVWNVETITETEVDEETGEQVEITYYSISSKDYSIELQGFYNAYSNADGGYIVIAVSPRAPLTHSIPSADIIKYYADNSITVPSIPEYSIAAENGGFDVKQSEDGFVIYVFGTTADELAAYQASLTGWTVDTEESTEKEIVLNYGETLAQAVLANYLDEAGAHYAVIAFQLKVVDWSDEQKASFEEHLHGVVPPYISEFSDLEWDDYYEEFSDYLQIGDLHESVASKFVEADWKLIDTIVVTPEESTRYGTHYLYAISDGAYGQAVADLYVVFYSTTYPQVTGLSISWEQLAWSPEQTTAFEEKLGVEMPFLAEFSGLEWSETAEAFTDYLYPSDVHESIAEALVGWTAEEPEVVTEGDAPGTYYRFTKESSLGGQAVVQLRVYEYSTTYPNVTQIMVYHEDGGDVPPTPGEPVTVEKTVEEIATANSWVSGTIYSSFQLDENITVTASAGNNNGKYWEASGGKQYRLFQSESGTMTISAPDGYVIQSITLTFNYQETGILMYGDTQVTSGTAVEVNAQSATFTVSQTDSSKHGKIFITSFVVVYAPVSE